MGYIYKPSTRKGPVFLSHENLGAPTITTKSGQTYTAKRGDQAGGTFYNEGNFQYVFPNDVLGQEGATLTYGGKQQLLSNSNISYRGDQFGSLQESSKGAVGSSMGGSYPGQFTPGSAGGYGVYPGYLGGMFPNPETAYVDPFKFGKKYGDFARKEIGKNFAQSQKFATDTLTNELKNLKTFVPAASAIKRSETSADNTFNQNQRTSQIDSVLPNARGDLELQRDRANNYARGRLPDGLEDSALELGIRSRAADNTALGGFGANSSVAKKASELMSAEQRLQIAQYGEGLISNNLNQSSNLLLAPTEYSNAGTQINVNPSVSPAQLTSSYLGQVNGSSLIPATTAFGAQIQQRQFNAQVQNQFALDKFGYNVGYAGAVAGAAQTDVNTNFALGQQADARAETNRVAGQVQDTGQVGAIGGAIGTIGGVVGSLFGKGGPFDMTGGSSSGGGNTGTDIGGISTDLTPDGGFLNTSPDTSGSIPSIVDNGTPSFSNDYNSGGDSGYSFGGGGGSGGGGGGSFSPSVQAFSDDLGFSGEQIPRSALMAGSGTLAGAGISYTPGNETTSIGTDLSGRPLFASIPLLTSTDSGAGAGMVENLHQTLAPMGAFSEEDSANILKIGGQASNPDLLQKLDTSYVNGDTKEFVNTLSDSKNVSESYGAFQLSQNWGSMSPAQKSLGVATLKLQNYKSSQGTGLTETPLIKPSVTGDGKVAVPGLTVGEGMQLLQKGYNTYSLVKNWDQINALQKIASGPGGASALAEAAKNFSMMGTGVTGAAAPGVSEDSLSESGWGPSPHFGIGAITSANGDNIPRGYSLVGKTDKGAIAIPTDNLSSQAVTQSGSLAGTAAGRGGVSLDVASVQKNWAPVKEPANNGVVGGSAMSAGLAKLGKDNPYLLGGMVANSIAQNTARSAALTQGTTTSSPRPRDQTLHEVTGVTQSLVNTASKLGSENAQTSAPYVNAVAAGERLYNVFQNPNATDKQKAEAVAGAVQSGTLIAKQAGVQSAGNAAPYVNAAMAAYNVSKVLSSDMSPEEKSVALRRSAENTTASIYTLGLSDVARYTDAKFFGGKGEALREKSEKYNSQTQSINSGTEAAVRLTEGDFKGAAKAGSEAVLNTATGGAYNKGQELAKHLSFGGFGGGGKSGEQGSRDGIRSTLQKVGVADKDFNVTLADGTQVNIGVDGHGGKHSVADPSKLTKEQSGITELSAYDNDYTNDLDYSAGMMGNTLTRLFTGEKNTATDQLGGQLGNALLGKDGFGKSYSQSSFNTVAANARAVAAQSGIKSKADGYQLANQAYAEGRLNESDHAAALQSFDMMYDKDGYSKGQKLMAGRFRGIEVASQTPERPSNDTPVRALSSTTKTSSRVETASVSRNAPKEITRTRSAAPKVRQQDFTPMQARTKDDVKFLNRNRYATV